LPGAAESATLVAVRAGTSEGNPLQDKEYQRRRRAIEQQLQEDLELLRAASQAKLLALEQLWIASASGPPDAASVTPASAESRSPAPVRRRGDVLADILEVFPRLPDVFDKSDVVRLLGYEPNRPALHRVWSHLQMNDQIAIERYSDGRRPQVFRKV
jgi:hypothetical protein